MVTQCGHTQATHEHLMEYPAAVDQETRVVLLSMHQVIIDYLSFDAVKSPLF